MKSKSLLAAILCASATTAYCATDDGKQCGGMEKILPMQQVDGIVFHKLVCHQISKTAADKFHSPLYRTTEIHYGVPRTATVTVGYSVDANEYAYKSVQGSIAGSGNTPGLLTAHKVLLDAVAAGTPGAVQLLKNWEAEMRVIALAAPNDTYVSFKDGVADANGTMVRGMYIHYSFNFPASSIDDAVSKATNIYAGIKFDMINSGAVAPLGTVSDLDQSGRQHPGD